MADKKVVAWFTMNGKHIPIYEGESKDDAVKRSVTQGSKQGVTAHEHPSKEKKYGIRQFTPNKIGVYYGDEKIGEVDSKEKAEQLMNQHKAKADTSDKKIDDDKSHLMDPDGKYGKRYEGITKEDGDAAMAFIKGNPEYLETFKTFLANGTDTQFNSFIKSMAKNAKESAKKKSIAEQNEDIKAKQISQAQAERDRLNGKKSDTLFKFDWDKLPGSATAHGEMVKYLKKNNIDWFNTPYFDLVADVDGDGNYYKLDHKGNGVVGIDRSRAYKKSGNK